MQLLHSEKNENINTKGFKQIWSFFLPSEPIHCLGRALPKSNVCHNAVLFEFCFSRFAGNPFELSIFSLDQLFIHVYLFPSVVVFSYHLVFLFICSFCSSCVILSLYFSQPTLIAALRFPISNLVLVTPPSINVPLLHSLSAWFSCCPFSISLFFVFCFSPGFSHMPSLPFVHSVFSIVNFEFLNIFFKDIFIASP